MWLCRHVPDVRTLRLTHGVVRWLPAPYLFISRSENTNKISRSGNTNKMKKSSSMSSRSISNTSLTLALIFLPLSHAQPHSYNSNGADNNSTSNRRRSCCNTGNTSPSISCLSSLPLLHTSCSSNSNNNNGNIQRRSESIVISSSLKSLSVSHTRNISLTYIGTQQYQCMQRLGQQ